MTQENLGKRLKRLSLKQLRSWRKLSDKEKEPYVLIVALLFVSGVWGWNLYNIYYGDQSRTRTVVIYDVFYTRHNPDGATVIWTRGQGIYTFRQTMEIEEGKSYHITYLIDKSWFQSRPRNDRGLTLITYHEVIMPGAG